MKSYSLTTLGLEHTLPVKVKEKNRYIKFAKIAKDDTEAYFNTDDTELQEAIEASKQFANKQIKLFFSNEVAESKKKSTKTENEVKPMLDVTTFAQAKEVLTDEPYNVGKTSPALRTPESIAKKAAELGISFPNLIVEE